MTYIFPLLTMPPTIIITVINQGYRSVGHQDRLEGGCFSQSFPVNWVSEGYSRVYLMFHMFFFGVGGIYNSFIEHNCFCIEIAEINYPSLLT